MTLEDIRYILIPLTALVVSQVLKFIIETVKYRKINFNRLLNGNGGMPSSHSALAFSVATSVGVVEGINSPVFALAIAFALIVAYDSSGVRRETGNQAVVINKIVMGLKIEGTFKDEFHKLKEQLGHKPLEVLFGALLGIVIGLLYTL